MELCPHAGQQVIPGSSQTACLTFRTLHPSPSSPQSPGFLSQFLLHRHIQNQLDKAGFIDPLRYISFSAERALPANPLSAHGRDDRSFLRKKHGGKRGPASFRRPHHSDQHASPGPTRIPTSARPHSVHEPPPLGWGPRARLSRSPTRVLSPGMFLFASYFGGVYWLPPGGGSLPKDGGGVGSYRSSEKMHKEEGFVALKVRVRTHGETPRGRLCKGLSDFPPGPSSLVLQLESTFLFWPCLFLSLDFRNTVFRGCGI